MSHNHHNSQPRSRNRVRVLRFATRGYWPSVFGLAIAAGGMGSDAPWVSAQQPPSVFGQPPAPQTGENASPGAGALGPGSAAQPPSFPSLPSGATPPPEGPGAAAGGTTPEGQQWAYIDLPAALRLAGARNGDLVTAYQRTLVATAMQQLAAARALPNLNGGGNFDGHSGALQQASGNILNVTRDSLYVGAGSNAVAAGTVSVPGIQYNLNLSDSIYNYLVTRPQLDRSRWLARATTNDVQLRVALAYGELLCADGARAIVQQSRDNAKEVARVTADFAATGEGRDSERERAATELERREAGMWLADARVYEASALLVEQLNLQSSIRLRPAEPWVVPRSIVPDPIPLNELVVMALYRRPELSAQRAAIHAAMLQLQASRMLPFSPQILAGFSSGTFGGGSNIVAGNPLGNNAPAGTPRFGDFADRTDTDVAVYWSLQNLGLGNRAMIQTARARLRATELEQLIVLNQVRAEVADAYARKQTQLAQLQFREQAVASSQAAYEQDLRRVRAGEGRPLEVLDSLRLVLRSRQDYLNTIIDYNEAQFALYTAMGQPPADLLARPTGGFNPAGEPRAQGAKR